MIYDKLNNYNNYINIHPSFSQAFEYLLTTDFSKVKADKYFLKENDIFSLVQEYKTKEEKLCKLEGHREYIDIQYMYVGEEYMGHSLFYNQSPTESINNMDVSFYDEKSEKILIKRNEFIIFFPHDLHKPCIFYEEPTDVKKVVIKIKI